MSQPSLHESAIPLISGEQPQSMSATDTVNQTREAPRQEAGYLTTMMNLVNTLTGAEILGVANSMTFGGLICSVALMVLSLILCYISAVIILKLQHSVRATGINELARIIIGPRAGDLFSILTLCFTYCCQVAYLIIGSDLLQKWLKLIGKEYWFVGWYRPVSVLIYAIIIPVMMTIPRKNVLLGAASLLACVCQVLFIAVMVYKAIKILPTRGVSPTVETYIIGLDLFNSFSMYSLMFSLAPVMLPLLTNFSINMRKRFSLIGGCFFACFIIVLVPSVIGYLIFGADTNQIILMSFKDKDILIEIVRVAYFIIVNASYPVIGISVLTDISSIAFRIGDPTALTTRKRIVALLIANVPPVLIAMFLPTVRPALEVGGAFGGCLSNYVFPPILYMVHHKERRSCIVSFLLILFAAFGIITAGIATYTATLDAIDAIEEAKE